MPEREVRTFHEGTLRWCKASGTGLGWQTAPNPASGLVGYVQAGQNFTITDNYATVTEKGAPDHHKYQGYEPVELTFTVQYGITADYPWGRGTSTGVTVSELNFELRASASEWHASSGLFWQLHKAVVLSQAYTENEDGNELAFTVRALSAVGPTGSGYIS